MISYKEHQEQLEEKLIVINNGKKYGQIVFFVGGAGSGKGFSGAKFMESEKYKIRDVDKWKSAFRKIGKLKDKYPEIRDLDLKNPKDVETMHSWIVKKGIKDKTLNLLLPKGVSDKKEILPNVLFDITGKSISDVANILPNLLSAGYNPANIHMIWVLTNYEIAVERNKNRDRVVPEDILLTTHKGAAETMYKFISGAGKKLAINGSIRVVLNNDAETVWYNDKKINIKGFTYLVFKRRGKPRMKDSELHAQLARWIIDNIPDSELKKSLQDKD
jgi:hypothetical protein